MPGAIRDELDQLMMGCATGAELIQHVADGLNNGQVRWLVPATDVVCFTGGAACEDRKYGFAMILYIQPVPDLLAVAVNGQRLAAQSVQDHQRHEFLRKLVGAIVVGTIRYGDRQTIRVSVGADQVITGGLGGRVGRPWGIGGELRERRIVGTERSVHLVR